MAHLSATTDLGVKIGEEVKGLTTYPFTSTFCPVPERFFLDPYVVGYTFRLLSSFATVTGKKSKLSPSQLSEMNNIAMLTTVDANLAKGFVAELDRRSENLERGKAEASLFALAMFAPEKLDPKNPLVVEAYQLSPYKAQIATELDRLMKGSDFAGQATSDTDQTGLVIALSSLTIGRHCRDHYQV